MPQTTDRSHATCTPATASAASTRSSTGSCARCFQPFFHLYFRLSRIGREHVPESGPVIFAANHRSFLDPFVIATIARRPMYYVAKEELFRHRLTAWFLNSLGAFPVRRGQGDADMLETAKAILARGDAVLMFPEGTRIRPGSLGRPQARRRPARARDRRAGRPRRRASAPRRSARAGASARTRCASASGAR